MLGDRAVTDHALERKSPFTRVLRVAAQFNVALEFETDLPVGLPVIDLLADRRRMYVDGYAVVAE